MRTTRRWGVWFDTKHDSILTTFNSEAEVSIGSPAPEVVG